MKEFKLPDIGEGIHEGEIVRWLVNEGDAVSEDQPIAEVMTDKATVEITSPYTGTVKSLNAAEGETVLVGATIIVIDDGASAGNGRAPEAAAEAPASPPPSAAPKASEPPAPPKAKEQAKEPAKPKAEEPAPAAPAAKPAPAPAARGVVAAPPAAASGPVLATPATRRLARELGVDLRALAGSGPRGRVTREDVQRANQDGGVAAPAAAATAPAEAGAAKPKAGAPAKRPPAPALPSGGEQRFPLRGLRKKIAEHMARSKRTAAHFTYVEEIDVTELVKLRREAKELAAEQDVKLTYLPFIMKAIVRGLKRFPMLNASLDEEKAELVHKYDYNFGIAVDTPDGLVVPVVKGVDHLSVLDLAREVERVATAARERTVALDDLRGGTFTITNAGNIGGLFATPVINHPEVAILGVHKISRRPVVRGDEIVIGDVMWLSISIDHRVVDGADGARFMNEVKRVLERPGLLLLEGV